LRIHVSANSFQAGDILAGQQAAIRTGKLVVNLNTRVVSVGDRQVHLTRKEYSILALLSLRKGATLTKEIILDHLYGGMDEPEQKIIDVFVCKLRKKLAQATGGNHYIQTIWGRGYALLDPAPLPAATLPADQDDPGKCHNAAGTGAGEERTLRQTHRPVPDQIEER
jgi:DNA-binding response OmpR family regulator